jgi:hypothetical protein
VAIVFYPICVSVAISTSYKNHRTAAAKGQRMVRVDHHDKAPKTAATSSTNAGNCPAGFQRHSGMASNSFAGENSFKPDTIVGARDGSFGIPATTLQAGQTL